jgi:hypothetical protein
MHHIYIVHTSYIYCQTFRPGRIIAKILGGGVCGIATDLEGKLSVVASRRKQTEASASSLSPKWYLVPITPAYADKSEGG